MTSLKPPFTPAIARQKVKIAQALWNSRSPKDVVKAYTKDSVWRNRSLFMQGHAEIEAFLTAKWEREQSYRLRKELFCFEDCSQGGKGNKIAVQFWYEYQDRDDAYKWKRCYGIEHWTFDANGIMEKRQMSGNDVEISDDERLFVDGVDVDEVDLPAKDF